MLLNFAAHQAAGGVRRIAAGALAFKASPSWAIAVNELAIPADPAINLVPFLIKSRRFKYTDSGVISEGLISDGFLIIIIFYL